MDFLFIAGAPGSGKSTVAQALQARLNSPMFEFAWIPEFQLPVPQSLALEEQLSFENLVYVIKNYVRHGCRNVIVTDLNDLRFREISRRFQRYNYLILTLVVDDEEILSRRVLDETRSSGYRDVNAALRHNRKIRTRGLLKNEVRVDNTHRTIEETVGAILDRIQKRPDGPLPLQDRRTVRLPSKDRFESYLRDEPD